MSSAAGQPLPGNRWDLLDGVTPSTPPAVSVVIAHYRQPAQLARTLAALRRQDYPSEQLEIIVADDGSPEPPTVPVGVRLVCQDDDGFRLAAVRNLGAAHARGELLVFLDADSTPEPGFVRELTRLPALAPDCVTVGRRRHADFGDATMTTAVEVAVAGRELPEPKWLSEAYRDSRNLLEVGDRSYRYVIGAVLSCSRRLFDEVGGFDETFTTYGGEDWDWTYRAWLRGAVLAHVPSAVAWHDGPDAGARGSAGMAKNEEAIRLSDRIPVPGSRPRGRRTEKVDIAVIGPPTDAGAAHMFISHDSVLAALPGAEVVSAPSASTFDRHDDPRLDRVRLCVELLRPVQVTGPALAESVLRVSAEGIGALVLADTSGTDLIRITALRAMARHRRWGRSDLFPTARVHVTDIQPIDDEPDIEAYLGGWA